MEELKRLVLDQETDEDRVAGISLRPQSLADFVGQKDLVENIRVAVQAARQRREPLEHLLFSGPPGLGKTSLAHIIAHEMNARITVTNEWHEDIGGFFYAINYALTKVPEDAAYFHAQWRRSVTTREVPEHVILDGVKGRGHYVGTYLAWTALSNGWWGEGEAKFFIDGDKEFPTICGTGTEDYFGGAWCFYGPDGKEQVFNTAFLGVPLARYVEHEVPRYGMYRWHIMDPIHFKKDLKVTIQALGWWPGGKYQPLTDDIASTALWYQAEPHAAYPTFPTLNERLPR